MPKYSKHIITALMLVTLGVIVLHHIRRGQPSVDINTVERDITNKELEAYVGKIDSKVIRDGYLEHAFDLPSSQDIYTRIAVEKIAKSEKSLIKDSKPIPQPAWNAIEQNLHQAWGEAWKINDDVYGLKPETNSNPPTKFSMYKSKQKLFTHAAEYGAEGPLVQKVMINNKPGFTVRTACMQEPQHCDYDIYYDGKFLSETAKGIDTSIKSPHFLFSYNNKLGFINEVGDGKVAMVFDGHYITDNFDEIHFENCCMIQYTLPTVYENGVLVFYAKRQNQNYIVEVDLATL